MHNVFFFLKIGKTVRVRIILEQGHTAAAIRSPASRLEVVGRGHHRLHNVLAVRMLPDSRPRAGERMNERRRDEPRLHHRRSVTGTSAARHHRLRSSIT